MEKEKVDILGIQETHVGKNNRSKREKYTWYMNGNEEDREYAGMAYVIRNQMNKYIQDIIPHRNRMLQVRLKGTTTISLLTVYAPAVGQTRGGTNSILR